MTDQFGGWLLGILASLISGVAMWMLSRATRRIDHLEMDGASIKERIHQVELHVAREMPTKEDFHDLRRQVESIAATMHEVRDMVIRMEAQSASK